METRWYLSPGQTLENTTIDDRGRALHITPDAWNKIYGHLDRKRLIQEAIDKQVASRETAKLQCKEMTKSWDNSVENARVRKEEQYLARIQKIKDDRMANFFILRKEQAERKAQFIQEAKRTMYISAGPPKTLTSALIMSQVLGERGKQIEFQEVFTQHYKEEETKYVNKIRREAREEQEEKMEYQIKNQEKKLKYREMLFKQMNDREQAARKMKETNVANEIEDHKNAEKESKNIERIMREYTSEVKRDAKKEFNDFLKQQQEVKKQKLDEEKEKDMVIDIYTKAKHDIMCLRRKKENEMRQEALERRDAISKKLLAGFEQKASDEDRIIKKAQDERDEEIRLRAEADEMHIQKLSKESREDYANFQTRNERRKKVMNEQIKWEMLNRYKANEVMAQYDKDKKDKAWGKKMLCRKELFDQMDQDKEVIRKQEEIKDNLYKQQLEKYADDDKNYFEYADEVHKYANNREWNTYPISKAVLEYKKENNLPWNSSKECEKYKK